MNRNKIEIGAAIGVVFLAAGCDKKPIPPFITDALTHKPVVTESSSSNERKCSLPEFKDGWPAEVLPYVEPYTDKEFKGRLKFVSIPGPSFNSKSLRPEFELGKAAIETKTEQLLATWKTPPLFTGNSATTRFEEIYNESEQIIAKRTVKNSLYGIFFTGRTSAITRINYNEAGNVRHEVLYLNDIKEGNCVIKDLGWIPADAKKNGRPVWAEDQPEYYLKPEPLPPVVPTPDRHQWFSRNRNEFSTARAKLALRSSTRRF